MKTIFTLISLLISVVTFSQKAGSLTLAITQQEPSCSRYFDGSITVTPSGGVAPYQYIWSNGETTATVDSLLAGNYSVSVIDANGQTTAAFITLVDPLPIIVTGISQNAQLGQSNGQIDIIDVINPVGNWTWSWASNNGYQLDQSLLDQTGLPTGGYKIIVTDANGCQGIGYFSINSYFTPSVNPGFKVKPLLNSTSAISTYPNPSNGNFTIESKDLVTDVKIVNINSGVEVFRNQRIENSINVDGLSSGDYIINYTINGEIKTERVTVL